MKVLTVFVLTLLFLEGGNLTNLLTFMYEYDEVHYQIKVTGLKTFIRMRIFMNTTHVVSTESEKYMLSNKFIANSDLSWHTADVKSAISSPSCKYYSR